MFNFSSNNFTRGDSAPKFSKELNKISTDRNRIFGKDLSNMPGMRQKTDPNVLKHVVPRPSSISYIPFNDENKNKMQVESPKKTWVAKMQKEDVDNSNLPNFISLYVKDIFDYLLETENNYAPSNSYMSSLQKDINEKMRAILIDWLVDVHVKFKLLPETLFMTVNLIDRYLTKVQVTKQHLQLVGISALLIACKYEEIYPPDLKDFIYIADNAYTKDEVLKMEGYIIKNLDFKLTHTSAFRFLERFALLAKLNEKETMLCKYMLELALMEYKMLNYSASCIASAAVYLTSKLFKRSSNAWSETLQLNTKYTELQVRPCAKDLCVLLQNSEKCTMQAIKRKYASPKYLSISKVKIEKTN